MIYANIRCVLHETWFPVNKNTLSIYWASLVAQRVKRLPAMRETRIWSLGWEDALEKEMAAHSSILAWRIPWMEEPGRLQSMGLQRVGHNRATSLSFFLFLFTECFLFGCAGSSLRRVCWLSLVATRGLSCPSARGTLFPCPGIEPIFPALEGRVLTIGPPGTGLYLLNSSTFS